VVRVDAEARIVFVNEASCHMNKQSNMFRAEIEKLAYQFWKESGKLLGSSEEDWFRAERLLLHEFGPPFSFRLETPMGLPLSSFIMGSITQ
jgi:hypothetical protein